MGWDEVPVAPAVTMGCGNSSTIDPVGASRTFTASVNQAANIVVTFIPADSGLNSVTVLSRSVTAGEVVTFTINTSNISGIAPSTLKGTNTIRVVATNSSGTGTGTCSWTLTYPAPTVSMECPGPSVYGTPPTFMASTDYSAAITITILNSSEEVVATYSETGSTISFTPNGIYPGTYTVCAVATNEYGTSSTICCSWTVQPEPLRIWRDTPSYQTVIDTFINQGATHRFKAKTNRDEANMSIVAINSATNTQLSITPVGPYPTNPGTGIESTIEVSAIGSYNVTATASAGGDSASISWIWIVSDQIGMCSTGYMDSELGLHIHLCATDYHGGTLSLSAIIGVIGLALSAGTINILAGILLAELELVYNYNKNPDDSIDIYISKESLILIPTTIVLPGSIPIPITIGTQTVIIFC